MKTLITTIITLTLSLPAMSFAETASATFENPIGSAAATVIETTEPNVNQKTDELNHKMHNEEDRMFDEEHDMRDDEDRMHGEDHKMKDKKNEKRKKDHDRKKMEEMTEVEKIAFFNKNIERMEKHIEKISNPEKKAKVEKDLEEFKSLSLADKEEWLKKNKKRMKKGKKHMKEMCEKIKANPDSKMPSDEEALERILASGKYKNADPEEQSRIMDKYNKIKEKSPEEKEAMFEKRKSHIKEKCEKMKK